MANIDFDPSNSPTSWPTIPVGYQETLAAIPQYGDPLPPDPGAEAPRYEPDRRYEGTPFETPPPPPPQQRQPPRAPSPARPVGGNYQAWFQSLVQGKPFSQQTLLDLEPMLNQYGVHLTPPNAAGERTKIQLPDGTWVRVGFGEGSWQWIPQGASQGSPSQYADPATQQLEAYLNEQMASLRAQREAQEQANVGLRARRGEAQSASDRLTKFLTERAARLQGPAYTGTEQEILRTQQLDPIERDRSAAHQRALHHISARGFDPESGIAQELLNQVDRAFDQQRASAQGELGYRQIAEQRSREQEAQQLLGYIPQAERAGTEGDLAFLQALDAAVNRPADAQLPLSMLQYQLPQQALQQALMAMGLAPSQTDLFDQAMSLYQVQQQNQNRGLPWWQTMGQVYPYLMGGR